MIADVVLGDDEQLPRLGSIELTHQQQCTARQVRQLVTTHGGAMIAERVGSGKTYMALAVARAFPSVLIVAPASLRAMWTASAARSARSVSFASYESLGRGRNLPQPKALVVFDEAHRLRNPATQQYARAAELSQRANVLLLSATPIQNRRADIAAQLALFLGRAAWTLSTEELTRYVVRSPEANAVELPTLEGPYELAVIADEAVGDDIVALPTPVPAADEGTAVPLLVFGLLHQWTSSQAALQASLKRRVARGMGLLSALESGRHPSRRELASWVGADDVIQLAFPELVSRRDDPKANISRLRRTVERHLRAVTRLADRLRRAPCADQDRARVLREIRSKHPGERIIAFAQFAETVTGLFRLLVRDGRVAALTAHGGRIASGCISRDEVVSQFEAIRSTDIAERLGIDLLLTTDVLSEGLNLQDASVVVHLDLPWNPARMEQRVGRVRRLGSRHGRIAVYIVQPAHAAERLLALERRLRSKVREAEQTIGVAGRILPLHGAETEAASASYVESSGRLRTILRTWQVGAKARGPKRSAIAAVASEESGFLAAVSSDDEIRLIANLGSGVSADPRALIAATKIADGRTVVADGACVTKALEAIDQWFAQERVRAAIDVRAPANSLSRRRVLTRANRVLARIPRHRRAAIVPLVAAARSVAAAPLSEGAERALERLVLSDLEDESWLRSIVAFGASHTRPAVGTTREPSNQELIAVILFQPG